MLIVRRRVGERIVVGGNINVTVAACTSRTVRLGIDAPRGVLVLRGEVFDSVVAANTASANAVPAELERASQIPSNQTTTDTIEENEVA